MLAIALLVAPAIVLWGGHDDDVSAAPPGSGDSITLADVPPTGAAARGRVVYDKYCVGCHGDEGRGDGAAARFLDPLPRDFQAGRFKFRSTTGADLPTVDDLMRTITCGLSGSAMPGFPLVPEQERRDVARFVLHLGVLGLVRKEVTYLVNEEGETLASIRGESLAQIRAEAEAKVAARRPTRAPASVPATDSSVAAGRALYDAQCASCHGATGRGDGSSALTLRDWKDAPIVPRDFTSGVYRAGSTDGDLFLRLKTGISGTPMPSFSGSDAELWSIVHYVGTLKDPSAHVPFTHDGCGGQEVSK